MAVAIGENDENESMKLTTPAGVVRRMRLPV
jgi:hypothetical protein